MIFREKKELNQFYIICRENHSIKKNILEFLKNFLPRPHRGCYLYED